MTNNPNFNATKICPLEMIETFSHLLQYYAGLLADVDRRTAPMELHDRKARKQMLTLLSRHDSLVVLIKLHRHTRAAIRSRPKAKGHRASETVQGMTIAMISRELWRRSNLRDATCEPVRAQTVQAARIVNAALDYQLAERAVPKNRKERPIKATPLLDNLLRQLSDYSGWKLFEPPGPIGTPRFGECEPFQPPTSAG